MYHTIRRGDLTPRFVGVKLKSTRNSPKTCSDIVNRAAPAKYIVIALPKARAIRNGARGWETIIQEGSLIIRFTIEKEIFGNAPPIIGKRMARTIAGNHARQHGKVRIVGGAINSGYPCETIIK